MSPHSDLMDPSDEKDPRHPQSENSTPTLQTSPLDLSLKKPVFPTVQHTESNDSEPPSPMDVLTIDIDHQAEPTWINAPVILIQPKSQWHYRSAKDLAKKHIPLVAGRGPQRTPLRVTVPPKLDSKTYLGIRVVTVNKEFHDSKVIVPHKTKAASQDLSHSNDLRCLKFTECHSTDSFDLNDRIVYLEVTDKEHDNHVKDVRVHMFNLYQNQNITKDVIELKQLHLCKLAFWFCTRDNNNCKRISDDSFSSTIQEKKNSTRSGTSQSTTNQLSGYIPSQVKCEVYENNDESVSDGDNNDDDDEDLDSSRTNSS